MEEELEGKAEGRKVRRGGGAMNHSEQSITPMSHPYVSIKKDENCCDRYLYDKESDQ